jgi:hypothetical protein
MSTAKPGDFTERTKAEKHGIGNIAVIAIGLAMTFGDALGFWAVQHASPLSFNDRVGKLPKKMKGYEAAALVRALKTDGRYAYPTAPPNQDGRTDFFAILLTPNLVEQKMESDGGTTGDRSRDETTRG